jgi:large subunit ribosomal protein L24
MSLRLRKDDLVQIVAGDQKGQTGKIIRVLPDKNRALVAGRNIVKRHTKASRKSPQGSIVEKEASIHLSNLMLVCSRTGKPTRIGIRTLENGKRVRYSKRAKELVD